MRCLDGCGYYYADLDDEGKPLTLNYCHFSGPEGWAPCEVEPQDKYGYESLIDDDFVFGSQTIEVHVDDIPEDATPSEIKDMALDIFEMGSHYTIEEIN